MPPKKPKPIPLENPKWTAAPVRKEGDIWKLPAVNSPMWTNQWAYQGSLKDKVTGKQIPYIVSQRTDGVVNGSVTPEGWACSCGNFTRNTPRTKCKHILNVMMSEGINVNKTSAAMANVDDAQLKAFKAWQKEQAAAGIATGVKQDEGLKFFGNKGRKIR